LARKKTVKWELERRFPARYTVSNSPRRTSRASRGNRFPCALELAACDGLPGLFGGKPMASLLAARRQYPAAALRLHAYAEAVRLGASASPRLKCALWQINPPLQIRNREAASFTRNGGTAHWPLQRLLSNLLVYSTPPHRVKKRWWTRIACKSRRAPLQASFFSCRYSSYASRYRSTSFCSK
jgi:hypothetical protein